jgi:hypothetical protein
LALVRSFHRTGALKTVAREMGKYKLRLVSVQEVRWEKGGTEGAEDYAFFCGEGNGNLQLGIGFFVYKRIVSAIRRVEFISDRMSYIILRGCWCSIIVLNVHNLCEDKSGVVKDSFYKKLGYVFDQVRRYSMKILLGDFIGKVGREDIFKLAIRNESLHEHSDDNGDRVVNYATSKNLIVTSTMFRHCNIHKYTWISLEGKMHNQIDNVLIDGRWHSSLLDVQSFRWADCDTDHYLVVAKVRERLAVMKQAAQKIYMERFNLKKLNEGFVSEQCQVTIRNTFTTLENLEENGDIN